MRPHPRREWRGARGLVLAIGLALASAACASFLQTPGTALARAAYAGDVAQIRALVAAGANPNEYDASRQTALHWAARGGHPPGPHDCQGEAAARAEVVALLVSLGADVDAVDRRTATPGGSSGWTPLHVAVHHEQFAIAATLLSLGANPAIRSQQGTTVIAMAADQGAPRALLEALAAGPSLDGR